MMRKIASLFFIFFGLGLLIISSSNDMMKQITTKMTDLDHVNRFQEKDEEHFVKPVEDSGRRNIDLYIYGDSYLMSVPDSAFSSINSYHFGRRTYEDLIYSLDPNK